MPMVVERSRYLAVKARLVAHELTAEPAKLAGFAVPDLKDCSNFVIVKFRIFKLQDFAGIRAAKIH